MVSKSKYELDNKTIVKLFKKAGIDNAINIAPLGAGEFNSVYAADANGKAYALKVAPSGTDGVLTYEIGMIEQEVYYYELMRKADITVPQVYYSDFTKSEIPVGWFIMERLDGTQLDKAELTADERERADEILAGMIADMHMVKGDKFGYRQMKMYDSWYLAIKGIVEALISDCSDRGKKTRRGIKLLKYIDKNKEVLEKADCSLINFDAWEPNIFCIKENGEIKLAWIDPERCFWGDRIADFICMETAKLSMSKKTVSVKAYNKASKEPITVNAETEIRFAVMMCYLALIQEVEKYARYSPSMFGWWRNVFSSAMFYHAGFKQLRKSSE